MFERASTIIRDGSKLDYAYVPKNLVHREAQMAKLETLFRPLAQQNRPCTAFLTGSVGTGKTATATRFCADLAEYMFAAGRQVEVVQVNCRNTSEAGVLLQIIRRFDPGFPSRGFSAEDMARIMGSHLASATRPSVIVLDEVDVLFKRGARDIVYQLTRPEGPRSSPVSLIMISQEPLSRFLDEASQSTFRRSNTVRFDRYSQQELREIVAARAEEALFPGRITEDALTLISVMAAEYGDARMALELLDRASLIAEDEVEGEVTVEHVRAAKAMTYSSVPESKLRELEVNRMIILLAVARTLKDSLSVPTSAVEKTYAVACEEYGVPVKKHTQFWTYLQDLDRQGFVNLDAQTDAFGKNTVVSLSDIPSKVLAEKMAELIESGGGDD